MKKPIYFFRLEPRLVLENVLLAVAYALAARVGLMLDAVSGFASVVWPASGIALGAVVLRGPVLAPGIWTGAFAANLWNGAPPIAAAGIGIGNSMEALAGCYALNAIGFSPALKRVRDALGLIVAAGIASPLVAASVGVSTLFLAGVIPSGGFAETWRAWWMGDMIGILTVAPMMMVWSRTLAHTPRPPRVLESAGLAAAAILAVMLVFAMPPGHSIEGITGVYLVYPLLIWAAVRFGPRGAISTGFVISAGAIVATVAGTGPFADVELHRSLLSLQMFVGVQAATFLVLGASIGERRAAEIEAGEARSAAESANRAKSEFLAVMSHELRTPLNAIAGYVQLMEMDVHGPVTAAQRDSLARIRRNETHLLALINDILGFARIETGNLKLHCEAIPVTQVLDDLEPLLRPDLLRKDTFYSASVAGQGLTVFADRERLRQVLLNVAGNAIKFTPEHGMVTLTAARDDAGCILLTISDTGIGISPDQIGMVFEPFAQAEVGRARNYPGVGLGLSIVRDLVKAMNGEVRLESKIGAGTTVIIKLPEGPPL